MTTAAYTAILAQATALRGISKATGYQTDLGASVIASPHQPDEENPSAAIFRVGLLGMAEGSNVELFRMEVTWAALVVGSPDQLDMLALDAQADLIKALATVCGSTNLRRIDIPAREPGSSSMIASVSITTTIQEAL